MDEAAGSVEGCFEWQQYTLTLDDAGDYELFIDDIALPVGPGKSRNWQWQSGFYAGSVLLEITDRDGRVLKKYLVDVSPAPGKVGREDFSAMLDELHQFDPALLYGTESAQASIGLEGDYSNVQLAYARLKMFGLAFAKNLRDISVQMHKQLRYRREVRPLHGVTRIDSATVAATVTDPTAAYVLRTRSLPDGCDVAPSFDVPSVEYTFDTPANRALLALARAVLRRTRRVRADLAGFRASLDTGDYAARLPRRIAYLDSLDADLHRLLSAMPFSLITRPEVSAAGLNTISAHPTYARGWRAGWSCVRSGLGGERSLEMLWMSPTWQVYERWAFLQVVQTISALCSGNPAMSYPSTREDCIRASWVQTHFTIEVYLQPRFPAHDQSQWNGFSSISGERFPDTVVTLVQGDRTRFVVLDAKYRVSRPGVLEGMESAHLYRDSLRWRNVPPDAAMLLVPAPGGAPWLEQPEFHRTHAVGVIALSRITGHAGLASYLSTWLDAAASAPS